MNVGVLLLLALGVIVVVIVVSKFRKATGLNYKRMLYTAVERYNGHPNSHAKIEILPGVLPGQWGYTLKVRSLPAEPQRNDMGVDELLALVLSLERELLGLPKIGLYAISSSLEDINQENANAYREGV